MAFISGPRQVGKTTLAKLWLESPENYFNWDRATFRRIWAKDPDGLLDLIQRGPIVLDDIHKDRRWKQRLKGLYDQHGRDVPIVVTGSVRLDINT